MMLNQHTRIFDPTGRVGKANTFLDTIGLPKNSIKAHALIEAGLDVALIARAAALLKITPIEMALMVSIDRNTFRRRESTGKPLTTEQGARLYMVLEVIDATLKLFEGNVEAAIHWLHQPAVALDDRAPVTMLTTPAGCKAVGTLVGRLEHGVIV